MPAAHHAGDPDCSESFPRLRGWPIGNTGRHHGNISLVLVQGDWHLSPTCDMLAMLCMPIAAGEVVVQELGGVEKMVPTAQTLEVWGKTQKLVLAFWEAVMRKNRIYGGLKNLV